MFIDSHVHLCDDTLFPHIDALITRAKESSVEKMVVICTNVAELQRGLQLTHKYPEISLVAGTTPHDAHTLGDAEFSAFESAARAGELVGLGETGLEYFHHPKTKEIQTTLFKRYMTLAEELNLPVVIHCRDAFDDFFKVIDLFPKVRGVLHCFTGSLADVKELVRRGWMISFSGIVTFKKSVTLQEVAKWTPIENILIETDAPYLAPQSRRGKVNEPSFLPEICRKIEELKGEPVEEQIYLNTKKFFW